MLVTKVFPNGEFVNYPDQPISSKDRPNRQKDNPLSRVAERCSSFGGGLFFKEKPQNLGDGLDKYWVGSYYDPIHRHRVEVRSGYDNYKVDVIFSSGEKIENYPLPYHPVKLIELGWVFSPLVYQQAHCSDKPPEPTPRKSLGFSSARKIRNYCYILEEEYSKDVLSFLTLTVPNCSDNLIGKIRRSWGAIISHFLDALAVKVKRKQVDFKYVSVMEIQNKRYKKYGQAVPHQHILFVGRRRSQSWLVTPVWCRKQFKRSCLSVLRGEDVEELRRVSFCSSENLQRIRKSASRYMAKYMSKGTSNGFGENNYSSRYIEQVSEIKSRWFSSSRGLSKQFRRAIQTIRGIPYTAHKLLISSVCQLAEGASGYWREKVVSFSSSNSKQESEGKSQPDSRYAPGLRIIYGAVSGLQEKIPLLLGRIFAGCEHPVI